MKKINRIIVLTSIFMLVFASTTEVFADDGQTLNLTVGEAVVLGIDNSLILDQVEIEIKLAGVASKRSNYSTKKLNRGDSDLRDAKKQILEAEGAFSQGVVPGDISLGDGKVIPAGTKIESLPSEIQNSVRDGIKSSLDQSKKQVESGSLKMINALQDAGSNISTALDFASLDALTLDSTTDVLNTMTDISLEVTQASFDIYKNNIALLIQKNYYDVLQAKQMLEVKKKAMERGKVQYEFSKASYQEGLKAKDDMLMASIYYRSTKVQYEKVQGDLKSAILELKKNLNIGFDKEVVLTDALLDEIKQFNLNEGLVNGMKERLEIKKSLGEVIIYNTNFNETKKRYTANTFQYQEAEILKEKAAISFSQAKLEVEKSIRQSHNDINTISYMLESTKEMVKEAQGNLDIALLKYKEGFGVETSLLKNLNLEDSAGTIVEVLAAEEKLAEIEENVVAVTYAYNLAHMQYLNNTGNFIY